MSRSRILSTVAAVGLIGILTTHAVAQLADFVWNPSLTGSESWQVSSNWTAPTFPGSYPYTIPTFPNDPGRVDSDSNATTGEPNDGIVFPSVGANVSVALGANLDLNVGASDVTVASLNMGGTASPVTTTVLSTGGKLVFENFEVNLTTGFSPQVCAFNCSAAQITSGGVAGSTNTISAPVQLDGERLEFSSASTNNLTLSGPITFFNGSTNGQVGSAIRSFMPSGTKATISGNITLVDTVTTVGALLTLLDNGQIPPATTNIQSVPSTGTIEISGVIGDSTATAGTGTLAIGTTSANVALSTLILSGTNTFRGRTTLNRANLILANNSALGFDSAVGNDRSGGAIFTNGNPSNNFGFNLMSDNDARTITIDASFAQWQTVTGTNSLNWAGLVTSSNARGWVNILPAGKTLTISGPTYASTGSQTDVDNGQSVVNRIFTYDGTGTTAVTGGLHDRILVGVPVLNGSLGHIRKAGTGTVLVSDPGSLTDYIGDVLVDQGVIRFASDAIFDQGRYFHSSGGAVGVDTGTFTNTTLLQKLDTMWSGTNLNHGGLMLTSGESAASIDFTSGDLGELIYMSVAAPQTGISYTGTITPATDPTTTKPTYRLGGGNATLTLPNSQLTGSRDLVVTNGGEVQLNGANTYSGVTRIQAKYHTTTQNQAIANTTTGVSNVVYEGTTLTVNTLLNGSVNSSIGASTSDASNLVIQGSTLKYVGTGSNGATNRLFTVGTGGATLDASGSSGSVMNFTSASALAMGVAGSQAGSIFHTGNTVADGIAGTVDTRSRVNVERLDDIIIGMQLTGPGVLSTPTTITAVNQPNPTFQNFQVTIAGSFSGAADSGTITFSGVARTLTLTGSNTDNNTLSPLVADAAAASGTNTVNVAKNGVGKWILTGNNTYSGTTNVNAGTLLINGTQTGTGLTTVAAGATLGGTGTIGGATSVAAGGNLAPGASAGTLTFGNGLDVSAVNAGGLKFELNTAATSDKVVLTAGTLNIGTLDFGDFTFTNLGGLAAGPYTLFDAASAITGSIGTAGGTIGSFSATLSLDNTNNDVLLTVASACSPGDLNCDGHVDASDYVYWRKNGLPTSSYDAWRAHFGNPPGSGSARGLSAGVPEPSSILLIGVALVVTIGGMRRRG